MSHCLGVRWRGNDTSTLPLPAFDSTVIHAEAAVRFALDGAST